MFRKILTMACKIDFASHHTFLKQLSRASCCYFASVISSKDKMMIDNLKEVVGRAESGEGLI